MPRRREYSYFPVVTYTTVAGTASPTIEWVDGIPAQRNPECRVLVVGLKVHKNENFFGFGFEFCTFSLLVLIKY
jgi:hypothetical protein